MNSYSVKTRTGQEGYCRSHCFPPMTFRSFKHFQGTANRIPAIPVLLTFKEKEIVTSGYACYLWICKRGKNFLRNYGKCTGKVK